MRQTTAPRLHTSACAAMSMYETEAQCQGSGPPTQQCSYNCRGQNYARWDMESYNRKKGRGVLASAVHPGPDGSRPDVMMPIARQDPSRCAQVGVGRRMASTTLVAGGGFRSSAIRARIEMCTV